MGLAPGVRVLENTIRNPLPTPLIVRRLACDDHGRVPGGGHNWHVRRLLKVDGVLAGLPRGAAGVHSVGPGPVVAGYLGLTLSVRS